MRTRPLTSTTQRHAEARLEREYWMQWRIARYGYACLTPREYAAVTLEMEALQLRGTSCDSLAVQSYVAAKMGVSQPRVSKLLDSAERAMRYFEDTSIWAAWRWGRGEWRLVTPVARYPCTQLI